MIRDLFDSITNPEFPQILLAKWLPWVLGAIALILTGGVLGVQNYLGPKSPEPWTTYFVAGILGLTWISYALYLGLHAWATAVAAKAYAKPKKHVKSNHRSSAEALFQGAHVKKVDVVTPNIREDLNNNYLMIFLVIAAITLAVVLYNVFKQEFGLWVAISILVIAAALLYVLYLAKYKANAILGRAKGLLVSRLFWWVAVGALLLGVGGFFAYNFAAQLSSRTTGATAEAPGAISQVSPNLGIAEGSLDNIPAPSQNVLGGLKNQLDHVDALVAQTNNTLLRQTAEFAKANDEESVRINWNELLDGKEGVMGLRGVLDQTKSWYEVGYTTNGAFYPSFRDQVSQAQLDGPNASAFKQVSLERAQILIAYLDAARRFAEISNQGDEVSVFETQQQAEAIREELDAFALQLNLNASVFNGLAVTYNQQNLINSSYELLGEGYVSAMVAAFNRRSGSAEVTATAPSAPIVSIPAIAEVPQTAFELPTAVGLEEGQSPQTASVVQPTSTQTSTPEPTWTPEPTQTETYAYQLYQQEACSLPSAKPWQQVVQIYAHLEPGYNTNVVQGYFLPCPYEQAGNYYAMLVFSGGWKKERVSAPIPQVEMGVNYLFYVSGGELKYSKTDAVPPEIVQLPSQTPTVDLRVTPATLPPSTSGDRPPGYDQFLLNRNKQYCGQDPSMKVIEWWQMLALHGYVPQTASDPRAVRVDVWWYKCQERVYMIADSNSGAKYLTLSVPQGREVRDGFYEAAFVFNYPDSTCYNGTQRRFDQPGCVQVMTAP